MGLLDDAIKEHLDLKRRRGADPAEVERAEREALGPVRRTPTSQSAEVADEPPSEGGFAYDHDDDESSWSGEALADSPGRDDAHGQEFDHDDEGFPEPAPEPQRPARAARPSRLARIFGRSDPEPDPEPEAEYDEPVQAEYDEPVKPDHVEPPPRSAAPSVPFDDPDAFEPPPAPAPARAPGPPAGGETVEYDVETALGGAEPQPAPVDDEDVLEETPEFLQDTPDHDRLWFEQRPPRDFDFDG
jgi:hypothetical protein